MGEGLTFLTEPFATDTEITGPSALKMVISSSTVDADIFAVLRLFDRNGKEIVFQGAIDPHAPLTQGWLRASHRKLDPNLSEPYRPYHTHDEIQPLMPGIPVNLDVELWPTSIVVPAGCQVGLTIRGSDYETSCPTGARLGHFKNELKGCGPFIHDDPRDRPSDVFGGTTTLHSTDEMRPYILLPVVPKQ
jgi:predicted acyl esterase